MKFIEALKEISIIIEENINNHSFWKTHLSMRDIINTTTKGGIIWETNL